MQATSTQYKTAVSGNDIVAENRCTIVLPINRRNSCRNGSFERSATGWFYSSNSLANLPLVPPRSSAHVLTGAWALQATFAAGSTSSVIFNYAGYTEKARAGDILSLRVPIWIATALTATYTLVLQWFDNDLNYLSSTITSAAVTPSTPTGAWTNLTWSGEVPAGAWRYTVAVWNIGAANTSTDNFWIDGVLYEVNVASMWPTYFDGDSANGSWGGDPGNSASALSIDPYPDLTLAIESMPVERQITTDMPNGTRLFTGYPTAQATVVLSGMVDPANEEHDATWLFNSADSTSPMYRLDPTGSPVVIKQGVYPAGIGTPELVTTFTGAIDDVKVDPVSGIVTLTCLDYRDEMRDTPDLPPVGSHMDVPRIDSGPAFPNTVDPGLKASWVMDAVLRTNGFYASPPPRLGCVIYASLNGSAYPTIFKKDGLPPVANVSLLHLDEVGVTNPDMQFAAGRYAPVVCRDWYLAASLLQNPGVVDGEAITEILLGTPAGGFFAEWDMNTAYTDSTGGDTRISIQKTTLPSVPTSILTVNYEVVVELYQTDTTTGWSFTDPAGGSHAITLGATWQTCSLCVTYPTTTTIRTRLWVDNVLKVDTTVTDPHPLSGPTVADRCEITMVSTAEAFQITADTSALPRTSFTPNAYLDESLNDLIATVDITGQDPWQIIQQLAEAELGVAGFDESGIFRFVNRQSLQTAASVRTVSAASSLKTVSFDTARASIVNKAVVPANTLNRSAFQAVWSAPGTYTVAAKDTLKLDVAFDNPVTGLATFTFIIPGGGISATPGHAVSGYRAARKADGTGGAVTNLTMTVKPLAPTSAHIEVYNPNSFQVYLVSPTGAGYPSASDGSPALALGGEFVTATGVQPDTTTDVASSAQAVGEWPPTEFGGAASSAQGVQAVQVTANPWMQNVDSAQDLADDIVADLYRSRPTMQGVTIVADPSLQLGDRITLVDPDTGLSDDAYIVSIRGNDSATDWTMNLDVRMVAPPGSWVMGQVSRSEMSVATYV